MSYLSVEKLSKSYKKTPVLKELTLDVEEGELVSLLGPSGCGKSTLLQCVAGLTDYECEKILLNQKNITRVIPQKRELGFVFQSYALFPNMTVFDNIAFGLKMRKADLNTIETKVNEMLKLVQLEDKKNVLPTHLSGGQQQRVALARALAVRPKLMLMDEPLSALDAKIRKNLREEIRRIQQEIGMTMIFVTHDQEEALTISDRIFIMHDGEIVQSGTPRQIYEHPDTEFAAGFIGSFNIFTPDQLGIKSGSEKEKIAVRPEVILLYPEMEKESGKEKGIWIKGKIRQKTLLGNIFRYKIDSRNQEIMADTLNAPGCCQHDIGEIVKIFIPERGICYLKK